MGSWKRVVGREPAVHNINKQTVKFGDKEIKVL